MHLLETFVPSGIDPPWPTDRFDSKPWHWGEPEPENATDLLHLDLHELAKMKLAHQGFLGAVHNRLPSYVAHRYGDNKDDTNTTRQGIVTVGGGKYFVLFSAFDEILFLDADNTAMRDVAPLFSSESFVQTGLVTWPDFWQTTVSPLYYEISSPTSLLTETSKPVMPITARPSTETGQLLIDKRRHWKTLLLAVYYNYYGPTFYYRLLNQGGTGMGDKETFLPAAVAVGLPAYQVHTPVERVGHRFGNNSTGSRVSVQYDPSDDWAITEAMVRAMTEAQDTSAVLPKNEDEWKAQYQGHVRPLFLHLSWPKWDPTNLLGHISKWSDMTMGIDGQPEPAFHHPPALAAQIRGTERMLWEEARWVACHLNNNVFQHWHDNRQAGQMCGRLNDHFSTVLDTDAGRGMGLGPEDVLYAAVPDENAM
ncbi:mannosyltransferase [Sporothrix bragantina]|uniref:Mannosyltransferase n=1 Tax=Sporothrix bragantina TaxID=671064 RepID=A0ABP0CID1_9PEZI